MQQYLLSFGVGRFINMLTLGGGVSYAFPQKEHHKLVDVAAAVMKDRNSWKLHYHSVIIF